MKAKISGTFEFSSLVYAKTLRTSQQSTFDFQLFTLLNFSGFRALILEL